MQYLVVVAPGDDITSFPNGEFAIRATSYMTAARGTLTSGTDPDASSGEYVADAQQIPIADFSSWFDPGPYSDTGLKDYTLEIPLQDLVDAGMQPHPRLYRLYASLKWPGEPAGDGLRDGTFWAHSSFIQNAFAQAADPMFISSGGEAIYDSYRTHYSMKLMAGTIRYFTPAPGDPPIADGRLYISLVSRQTEIGTIVPRIDQLVLIPFDSSADPDGEDWLSADPNADRVEAGLLYDDALNGTWSADDQIITGTQVMDYQEATGSDGAEFTGAVVNWSGGASLPYEKVWMLSGINNRDDGVVADDGFGRSTSFGGSWNQVLGATESGAMYWSESSRQGGSEENNINGLGGVGQGGYQLDGSQLVDLQVSSYYSPTDITLATSTDVYAALGINVPGTDVGYNSGRAKARTWNDARDWDVKCRVTWDKVPETTFQIGPILSATFATGSIPNAKLASCLSWCMEMDESGVMVARMRLNYSTLSGYPTNTFPADTFPPSAPPDQPDNNYLNVLSVVIAEAEIDADVGDWIWLRVQRRGYRVRGKAWVDGDTEPVGWDVDAFVPRGEEDGGGTFYILDYPYVPTAGRELQQSRFNVDFQFPGMTAFVETWNSYQWVPYGGPSADLCSDVFWQHVGWPQNVCDYITAGMDGFEVSYPNDGSDDPVDCNIRCYDLDDQPITGTCVLPKGAQYIGYVGRIKYSDFDAGTGTVGPLFKFKAWNDPGAPPLQGVLTKLPRGLRVGPPVIGLIKGGPKLYGVV